MLQRLYISTEEYFALPYASNSTVKEAHKMLMSGDIADYNQEVPAYYFGAAIDAILTDPENVHTMDLTRDQQYTVLPICKAIQKNKVYQALFSPEAGREHQAVFVDTEFQITVDGNKVFIPAKCKFDWWNPKKYINFGGDLKTTDAQTENAFRSAAKWFDYPQQAAWYMDITGTDKFVILGVSKRNYQTWVITIKRGDSLYESGKEKYLRRSASWYKLNGNQV